MSGCRRSADLSVCLVSDLKNGAR